MRKQYLIYFCIGIFIFVVAFIVEPWTGDTPSLHDNDIEPGQAAMLTDTEKEQNPHLKKLLQSLMAENKRLKQVLESEKLSHAKSRAASETTISLANRYNFAIESIIKGKKIDELSFNLSVMEGDLQPSNELIELIGLGAEQADELKRVCKIAFNELQELELQNATVIKQTDNMLTYEIRKLPEEYINRFIDSIKAIISEDYHDTILELALNDLKRNVEGKFVTLESYTDEDGREIYDMLLQILGEDGKPIGPKGEIFLSNFGGDVVQRWNHLFEFDHE